MTFCARRFCNSAAIPCVPSPPPSRLHHRKSSKPAPERMTCLAPSAQGLRPVHVRVVAHAHRLLDYHEVKLVLVLVFHAHQPLDEVIHKAKLVLVKVVVAAQRLRTRLTRSNSNSKSMRTCRIQVAVYEAREVVELKLALALVPLQVIRAHRLLQA